MIVKKCVKCCEEKSLDEFHWRNKSAGKKSSYCKKCKQEYESDYYRNNKSRKKQIRKQAEKSRHKHDLIILEYKKYGCVDCGEKNPIVLDFDHISNDKIENISRLRGGSLQKLLEEIGKCEVVCANCHRIRTHTRRLSS